jgi:hypothetical protein
MEHPVGTFFKGIKLQIINNPKGVIVFPPLEGDTFIMKNACGGKSDSKIKTKLLKIFHVSKKWKSTSNLKEREV